MNLKKHINGPNIFLISGTTLAVGLAYFAYLGYHSPKSVEYRETRAALEKTVKISDDSTVKRYTESGSQYTIREFTAHDGKLLCVSTLNHRGNAISCVKIEQPQSCKASY